MYLNKVGTFGVSSAGYRWGRAGGAIMRLGHYMVGYTDALWALLYSDDGKLTGRSEYPERGLLLFLLSMIVVRVPLSWHKVKGAAQVEWIGYLLNMGRFELGVTASRAAWASRWLTDNATEGAVKLGELREALGRRQLVAGPIEYVRPFLGPLYAGPSIGNRYAKPKLPTIVLLIMRYIAKEVESGHMMRCAAPSKNLGEMFRLDAKADGHTQDAEWFSVTLARATAPCVYARGEPFRTIAALELLGTLVSLAESNNQRNLSTSDGAGGLHTWSNMG